MPTVVTDPLHDLVGGIVQGYHLAHQIKQQAMAEEAHQRNLAAADHEAQVRDIQTRMMLGNNARPVQAGTVQDQMAAAPLPRSGGDMGQVAANLFPEMQGGEAQAPIVRPVDKSRRVTYTGRDGQKQDYELLTAEEQMKQQMDRAMASPQMLSAQFNQHSQDLRTGAVNASRERIAETTSASRERAAAVSQSAATTRAADNRTAAEKRAAAANTSREKIAAGRNATTLKAAETRRDAPTPNAAGVADRFKQRQLENDQKNLRDLEQKEAALHAEKIQTGQSGPGAKDDAKAFTSARTAKLAGLDIRIKGIQEAKQKLIGKWQTGALNPPAAPAASAAARPQATNPQTGETVEYDGKAWVPVK